MTITLPILAAALVSLHPAPHAARTAEAIVATMIQGPERIDLGNGLYAIINQGGNILVSTGPDGMFAVDSQFSRVAEQNLRLMEEVSDTPLVFLLNTHHHGDHTGGNAPFTDAGATILAHDNVRARLAGAEAANPAALPVITFSSETTFHWNGQAIHIRHLPAAHTDGDSFVHIPNADIIHTGDVLFASRYPFIDLNSGGTVSGYIAALESILDHAGEDTAIVPGHGPVSGPEAIEQSIGMLREGRDLVRAEMMKGQDRDAVIAANPLKKFNDTFAWQFIDGDRMAGTFFDDLLATDQAARAAVEAAGRRGDASGAPSAEDDAAAGPAQTDSNKLLDTAQAVTREETDKAKARSRQILSDVASVAAPDTDGTDAESGTEAERTDR